MGYLKDLKKEHPNVNYENDIWASIDLQHAEVSNAGKAQMHRAGAVPMKDCKGYLLRTASGRYVYEIDQSSMCNVTPIQTGFQVEFQSNSGSMQGTVQSVGLRTGMVTVQTSDGRLHVVPLSSVQLVDAEEMNVWMIVAIVTMVFAVFSFFLNCMLLMKVARARKIPRTSLEDISIHRRRNSSKAKRYRESLIAPA